MKTENRTPPLHPIARFLLNRYKNRLLDMPCTREASALVDCIDFLLEAERKVDNA